VANALGPADLKRLARIGAALRIQELEAEIATLRRAFPGVSAPDPAASAERVELTPGRPRKGAKRGRRRPMSVAERKAVSERMQKYWAERRKGKDKG
jgi:hypothetical protein